jgi:hypothetical protein
MYDCKVDMTRSIIDPPTICPYEVTALHYV